MDFLSLKSKIENIGVKPELDDFITLSKDIFYINEVHIIPGPETLIEDIYQIVKNNQILIPERIKDLNYTSRNELISCGNLFVSHYSKFINNLSEDLSLSFDSKMKHCYEAINNLELFTKAHNVINQFTLASKIIFQVHCLDGKALINFSNILFSSEEYDYLQEIFSIRKDIFSELLNITDNYLHKLEYNSFKFSKFKMNPESGKYLLHEFIIGLEIKNDFINLNSNEQKQLEKQLFQLFGLQPPEFGYLRGKILDRKEPARELQKLVLNVEEISNQLKKARK
jgi:hypothetical protein